MQREFTIFLDENQHNNQRILSLLVELEIRVERHGAHFPAGTPDAEWLPLLQDRGWCLLTTDQRIRFRPLERAAVKKARIGMFCFTSNNMSGAEMVAALRLALPQMRRHFTREQPPFIATISKGGHVSIRERFQLP